MTVTDFLLFTDQLLRSKVWPPCRHSPLVTPGWHTFTNSSCIPFSDILIDTFTICLCISGLDKLPVAVGGGVGGGLPSYLILLFQTTGWQTGRGHRIAC